MRKRNWKMPDWMERYRDLVRETGGNSIEYLMNEPPANVQVNAPLALIQVAVEAQVHMLERLRRRGLL